MLPSSAYFPAGRGPTADAIRSDLQRAGFANVSGATGSGQISEFWIEPSGEPRMELSPPGTQEPKQRYDLDSLITLVGTA